MRSTLRSGLGSGLLMLVALGCDDQHAFEPDLEAARGGSGSLAAPSNTGVVAVSESRIDVSWQDNADNESGFEVHRSTTGAAGTFTLRASTGAGVTSFSDAGLSHSTEYCYKVRAFRISGRKTNYSAFSSAACATTPAPPPPAAPSMGDAYPVNSSQVFVYWSDNSSNEDGFRLERSLDQGLTWATAASTGPGEWWHYDAVTSDQLVCYRVLAFNAGGDSPASSTDCTAAPAAPTNLVAVIVDAFTVDLTWSDNSGVEDGYEVWAIDTVTCYYCQFWLATLAPDAASFRYEGDPYAGGYVYYVIATKDGGRSDQSNEATPTAPGAAARSAPAVGSRARPLAARRAAERGRVP
jgi:hypothetical protein